MITNDDDALPPVDVIAHDFIVWLEARGAVWSWRPGLAAEWWLDLNGVHDMSQHEASEIAAAAFDMRDAIRAVLLDRRDTQADAPTIH